jgi:putative solute:sodium symporter small subunit
VESKPPDVRGYWHASLRVMGVLLAIWLVVSYGLAIAFVEPLNDVWIGGFPLGFWFAHQGSMYVFIALVWVYAFWMDRIDKRFGLD